MITKTVECPSCKHIFNIQGNTGENVRISCPKCKANGFFSFPGENLFSKTSMDVIKIKNLTKINLTKRGNFR